MECDGNAKKDEQVSRETEVEPDDSVVTEGDIVEVTTENRGTFLPNESSGSITAEPAFSITEEVDDVLPQNLGDERYSVIENFYCSEEATSGKQQSEVFSTVGGESKINEAEVMRKTEADTQATLPLMSGTITTVDEVLKPMTLALYNKKLIDFYMPSLMQLDAKNESQKNLLTINLKDRRSADKEIAEESCGSYESLSDFGIDSNPVKIPESIESATLTSESMTLLERNKVAIMENKGTFSESEDDFIVDENRIRGHNKVHAPTPQTTPYNTFNMLSRTPHPQAITDALLSLVHGNETTFLDGFLTAPDDFPKTPSTTPNGSTNSLLGPQAQINMDPLLEVTHTVQEPLLTLDSIVAKPLEIFECTPETTTIATLETSNELMSRSETYKDLDPVLILVCDYEKTMFSTLKDTLPKLDATVDNGPSGIKPESQSNVDSILKAVCDNEATSSKNIPELDATVDNSLLEIKSKSESQCNADSTSEAIYHNEATSSKNLSITLGSSQTDEKKDLEAPTADHDVSNETHFFEDLLPETNGSDTEGTFQNEKTLSKKLPESTELCYDPAVQTVTASRNGSLHSETTHSGSETSSLSSESDYDASEQNPDDVLNWNYCDMDEESIFREMRAIDSLLSDVAKESTSVGKDDEEKKEPKMKDVMFKDFEKIVAKDKEQVTGYLSDEDADEILSELERFLEDGLDEDVTLETEMDDSFLSQELEEMEHPVALAEGSNNNEILLPVQNIKTAARRRRIISRNHRTPKIVTSITYVRPSTSKVNAEDRAVVENSSFSKTFTSKGYLKIPCKYCGEAYYPGPGMASHIKWKHRKEDTQTCPHCCKTFKDQSVFIEHLEKCRKTRWGRPSR